MIKENIIVKKRFIQNKFCWCKYGLKITWIYSIDFSNFKVISPDMALYEKQEDNERQCERNEADRQEQAGRNLLWKNYGYLFFWIINGKRVKFYYDYDNQILIYMVLLYYVK